MKQARCEADSHSLKPPILYFTKSEVETLCQHDCVQDQTGGFKDCVQGWNILNVLSANLWRFMGQYASAGCLRVLKEWMDAWMDG